MKRVAIGIAAVVVGTLLGMVVMTGLHSASALVYPPPEGIDLMSSDPLKQALARAWMETLPAGAFVLAWMAHWMGCMSGAAIASLIDGRRSIVPAAVVGALFTVAGILNLREIPHPSWFGFVDVPSYLLVALIAGKLLLRQPSGSPPRSGEA